ncbi:MAG TPA: hypothetical protein VNB29_07095 [Chthoniobacterales bacterium]|nr:hypothetical protein [Chthoniobacterales bacterium]
MNACRALLLAASVAVLNSSCMSLDMVAHAEGKAPPTDPQGPPYDPQPAYYALVPLVAPLDLITLPIQYFYFRGKQDAVIQQQPPPPPQRQY